MPIEYYVLAILSSTAVFFGIKFIKHAYNVNIFYNRLQDLFNAYYAQYPAQSPEYFCGIVERKSDALLRIFETDFNNFILDSSMMKELYEGADLYVTKREEEARNAIQCECAWCDNVDAEKFLWFETKPEDKKGTIQCQECLACCPLGTYDECIELIKPLECECGEKHEDI